ncbi:hypothetical protein ANAPRD1_01250 [Anaplasma phagocytophilum]|nr:hypothetical protein ANAPRD1_01250 [Anaplasma phagocytophilum]
MGTTITTYFRSANIVNLKNVFFFQINVEILV